MWKFAEDIIEYIAGYRLISGQLVSPWNRTASPISLARYDVAIIESLANQTVEHNRAYTTKQSQLAIKIIYKYRKQLSKLNINLHEDPTLIQFRLGTRFVDQSKTIKLDNGRIAIKFPFDTEYIKNIKSIGANGYGSVQFDNERKIWYLGLTEYMINFAVAFGVSNNFTIDTILVDLADKIVVTESKPYKIQLYLNSLGLDISNASNSLKDYINDKLGGFNINNLYTLIDNSQVLGYDVEPTLIEKLAETCSDTELTLIQNRKIEFNKTTVSLDSIIDYAKKSNRLPVYLYDMGLPKQDTDNIVYLNNKRDRTYHAKIKLMVSTSTLLVGYKKQDWLRRAEKVVILK